MDPDEARSHWLLGASLSFSGDRGAAARCYRRSLELNPNDANVRATWAMSLAQSGKIDEAIALSREAMRLNPYHPEWYWTSLGGILYHAGRYEEVIEVSKHRPNIGIRGLCRLAASHAYLGRTGEAQDVVADVLRREPGFSLSKYRFDYWGPLETQVSLKGMRKAGLPE